MAQALQVPPLSMKAVLASYTLSLAVFIPISGWMANRFGTRRVFASAIGIFTLGSFLCGISNDIHLLVACRILQGCGGAMMLPVGRITMVRTFAKSELINAMSFVAIPGLVGPMLGPVLGGAIIGYFHWSVIFFVNIPIGLCGLVLVYRHLPNYREERNYPLDIIGLVLVRLGHFTPVLCARSVRRDHLERTRDAGIARDLRRAARRLRSAQQAHRASAAALEVAGDPHLSGRGKRQSVHALGDRRNSLPVAAAVSGRSGILADPVRTAHHAAGARGDEPETDDAVDPEEIRLPQGADRQHPHARDHDHAVLRPSISARRPGSSS